jgi:hypothetical protein
VVLEFTHQKLPSWLLNLNQKGGWSDMKFFNQKGGSTVVESTDQKLRYW